MPAEVAQLDAFFDVALFVAFYFLFPELAIALGHYKVFAAFVTVPEAAVNEDDCLVFAQYYVGGAGQAFDVYAVAVAMGMEVTAHNQTPSPQSANRQLPSGRGAVFVFLPLMRAMHLCRCSSVILSAMSRRYSFLMDFVPGFWWKNLAGLNVWICRVFVVILLYPFGVTPWKMLTLYYELI